MSISRHHFRHRVTMLAAIAGVAALAAGTLSTTANASSPRGSQGLVSAASPQAGTGSRSGVTGGALFGGTASLTALQGKHGLGRKLAVVRVYYTLGGHTFPTTGTQNLLSRGKTLIVSLDSVYHKKGASGPTYSEIAHGDDDTAISAFLTAVNNAAVTYKLGAIYICFEHEPENPQHKPLGTAAQFVNAWDHVRKLAANMKLNWNEGGRLHWVLILMHATYAAAGAGGYWPGKSKVDIVAADGYNHQGCKTGSGGSPKTPGQIFGPTLSFATSHGLPMFISEWGSQASHPTQQATFIHEMQTYVTDNTSIKAASYFDYSPTGSSCSSLINNNPNSVQAMATMGQAPALQGHVKRQS